MKGSEMAATTAPRRNKAQNQAVRAMKLALVLHQAGITSESFLSAPASQLSLAESILHFDTPASDETLAMCADFLTLLDEIAVPPLPTDRTPIVCEGHVGYIGAANSDLDSPAPIKTSVSGTHDGRKVTVRVRLSQDGALELASRMLSVVRKVDAEKCAAAVREEMRDAHR